MPGRKINLIATREKRMEDLSGVDNILCCELTTKVEYMNMDPFQCR